MFKKIFRRTTALMLSGIMIASTAMPIGADNEIIPQENQNTEIVHEISGNNAGGNSDITIGSEIDSTNTDQSAIDMTDLSTLTCDAEKYEVSASVFDGENFQEASLLTVNTPETLVEKHNKENEEKIKLKDTEEYKLSEKALEQYKKDSKLKISDNNREAVQEAITTEVYIPEIVKDNVKIDNRELAWKWTLKRDENLIEKIKNEEIECVVYTTQEIKNMISDEKYEIIQPDIEKTNVETEDDKVIISYQSEITPVIFLFVNKKELEKNQEEEQNPEIAEEVEKENSEQDKEIADKEKEQEESIKEEITANSDNEKSFDFEDEEIHVTVKTNAEVPNGAEIKAIKINEESAVYNDYKNKIATRYETTGDNITIFPYDIHFEKDGEKITVEDKEYQIEFTFNTPIELNETDKVALFHFHDNGLFEEVFKYNENKEAIDTLNFSVNSFSDFVPVIIKEKNEEINTKENKEVTENSEENDDNQTQIPKQNVKLKGAPLRAPATNTTDKFAILYEDGDLVFQVGNETDDSKGTVLNTWTNFDNTSSHPWSGNSNVRRIIYNTEVTPTSCSQYFNGMTNLEEIVNIENLKTDNVTSCYYMFFNCQKLKEIDFSGHNTENVTNMSYMFYQCSNLLRFTFNGDVSKVTTTEQMFYNCPKLYYVDMNDCEFDSLSNARLMFQYCYGLRTLKCENWGMSNLTNADYMFCYDYDLEDIDVSNWNPTLLSNARQMFCYARKLEYLDLSNWGCTRLSSIREMFESCTNLKTVIAPNWTFLSGADLYYVFASCTKLSMLDISGWQLTSPANISYFLYYTPSLGSVDLSGWNISNGASLSYFFYNSGISAVTLGPNWRFANSGTTYLLPAGSWRKGDTEDTYTPSELRSAWNSTMADTYRKVTAVNFDGNGGNASKRRVVTELDQPIEDLPTATRDGYTFLGWFTDPNTGTELHDGDIATQSRYYAHWEENHYTLILKRNVEDDPDDTDERISLTYTEIYQLDPDIFENEDKVLQGWTLNRDGTGKIYSPDEKLVMLVNEADGVITMYAKWGRTRNATVTFDSQGGSEVNDIIVERGSTIQYRTYQTPVREGYTFQGWYTEPDGAGTRYDLSNKVIDNSLTLYAKWVKNPIVTFHSNGGWVETETRVIPYNTAIGALPNAEARPEKLIGYFTSQEPGEGEKLTTTKIFTEDAEYWAHWGYQPYFNTNGGKITGTFNINTVYPVDYPAEQRIHTFPNVVKDGYTLVHWELPDGTVVEPGDVINIHDNPEIIAIWERENVSKVTFDPNGGAISSGTNYYEITTGNVLEYIPNATKMLNGRRMEFLGWYDEDDNLLTRETVIEQDTTFTAKWAEKQYKITFNPQGGTTLYSDNGSGTNTRWLAEGEKMGIVPGTYKANYLLDGWYTQPNGEGEKLTEETTVTEDTTYYANWIDNKVDKVSDDIEYKFWAEWTNASNDQVDNVNNNLNFHPTYANQQTASLHLHFELNSQVATTLPTGSVKIKIPQYVVKGYNGENTGTNNLSSQMSLYPRITSGMWFSYMVDGEDYYLINNQPLAGGAGIDMTLSYRFYPYDVPGGATDVNGDYIEGYDYYHGEVPVEFSIQKDPTSSEPDTVENVTLTIENHTKSTPTVSKAYYSISYEWNTSWGTKPADADDYFYITWHTTYAYSGSQYATDKVDEIGVHDGTIVAGSSLNNTSNAIQRNSTFSTVTKHPKTLLENIPASGIPIVNESRHTLTLKSGYQQTVNARAVHRLYSWEYTRGEFDKNNTNSNNIRTINGGQEDILDNKNVNMDWHLWYQGTSRDTALTWDDETDTYHADQRIISLSDGVNRDLMYSSGSPYSKYVWEPTTGNYILEDNDYTIKTLSIYVNEWDCSYYNEEFGGPVVNNDISKWKDVDIYIRYRNTDEMVFWKSIRPSTSTTTVTLPNDVVGYEVRYPTSYFQTKLDVRMNVDLHPTANVRARIYSDTQNNTTSIIKNRGYCNIWTADEPYTDPCSKEHLYTTEAYTNRDYNDTDVFFHATDWTGGMNGASKEIYELNKSAVYLYTTKYAANREYVLFDVERGYQENPMEIAAWTYSPSGKTKYFKNGTFYDLLPRGTTVPEDSIFGILSTSNTNSLTGNPNNYSTLRADTENHLAKEFYDVRFEENWENSGRTMMIIKVMVPETLQRNMIKFYYLLHMTYADVVNYGTSTENDVSFADESNKEYEYSAIYNGKTTITEYEFYEHLNLENDQMGHAKANTNYIPVDAFSWGFDKTVKTGTDYTRDDVTIPNNIYTYKLNFSQSDYATSNSVVFYDVLETGAYNNEGVLEEPSEWYGYFDSIDVSSIRSKKKANTTNVYCDPVVYYSTKAKDQFTGSDYDVTNSETWTTEMPADKTTITAIAVDCTHATDGSQFSIKGRQSMAVYINMRAPEGTQYIGKTAVNQAKLIAKIYETNEPENPSEATSDTRVTIEDSEPDIHKTSDPESGTEEEPTVLSYGEDLDYTITVKNNNESFTVKDYVVEDEVPEGVQVKTSDIKVHFGNPENAASVSVSPRVDMKYKNGKLTFTIRSLMAGETAYIIVPTRVIATGNDEPIQNTAKITSINGVEKNIESETTWHEVQYDVIFSKQSDQKQLVVGAHLQLYDADTNELIEEWDTTRANKTIRLYMGNFLLKETQVPDGYAKADDIRFTVQEDGTILYENGDTDNKVVMVDVASTEVHGQKTWKWDKEEDRPDSITVVLQRNGEDYQEKIITAADNWAYDFGKIPKYDNTGNKYEYSVIERPVTGYTPTYTDKKETTGLAITFSNKTATFDENDWFEIYYEYKGKMFIAAPRYYGPAGDEHNPAGTTIRIPTDKFYVIWHSNNAGNAYGFKFDSIIPIAYTERTGIRMNMPDVTGYTTEILSGNKYPETDHDYFINENLYWEYSHEMEGDVLNITNTKNNDEFDIPINKVDEEGNRIGGVQLRITSAPEVGDPTIDPIMLTSSAEEPNIVNLEPGRYILHEESPVTGYQKAEDIIFYVNEDGEVIIDEETYNSVDMLDKYVNQPYPFKKVWMDTGYEELRPESVSFNLVRLSDNEIIETKTLTAGDATDEHTWEGAFENVPMVDENWDPIEYAVVETTSNANYKVLYEIKEKKGLLVKFSEDSDIGDGKLYIRLYGEEKKNEGTSWKNINGTLVMNEEYGMEYLEKTDMAGKTFYIPIVDNVEGFVLETEWAENSVHVGIESIVPTTEEQEYTTIPYEISSQADTESTVYTGANYPVIDGEQGVAGRTFAQYIWNKTDDDARYESEEIVNYINKTSIPLTKIWSDNNNENEDRPSSVTLNIFNVNDSTTPVKTVELTSEDAIAADQWTKTINDLPRFNNDGSIAQYTVKEANTENYHAFYGKPKGMIVKFTKDSYAGYPGRLSYIQVSTADTTNQENAIRYVAPQDNLTETKLYGFAIAGKSVYVPIEKDGDYSFAIYNSDPTAHIEIESVSLVYSETPIYAEPNYISLTTANVPQTNRYSGTGNFDITGKTGWNLYTYTGAIGNNIGSANGTVINEYDKIDIPFTKTWANDEGFEEKRPESLTFNLYNQRDMGSVLDTITLNRNEMPSGNVWNGIFRDRPKYNDDGSLAVYVVKEASVPVNYTEETSVRNIKGFAVTFGNVTLPQNTNLYILQSDGNHALNALRPAAYDDYGNSWNQNTPLAGKTIYVPLYDNNAYEFCIGLTRASTSYNPSYSIQSIKPVYEDIDAEFDESISIDKAEAYNSANSGYSEVKATSFGTYTRSIASSYLYNYVWFKWDVTNKATGETNTLNKIPVTFNKYSNVHDKLAGAVLQIKKEGSEEVLYEWETNVEDKCFYLPEGTYVLHEATAPTGFQKSDDITFVVTPSGNVQINNANVERVRMFDPELIDVKGTKNWAEDTASQRPASITVNLLRDGNVIDSKVVTAADNWKYEFTALPKYNGTTATQYEYAVTENVVRDYNQAYDTVQETDSWESEKDNWNIPGQDHYEIEENVSTANGLKFTFSPDSQTESTNWDYLYIYYKKDGRTYYINKKFGGNGNSNNIKNAEIVIPSDDVYFYWHTDGSVTYWGWKIINVEPVTNATTPANVTTGTVPNYTKYEYSGTNYPETPHPYNNSTNVVYHYTTSLLTSTYDITNEKGQKIKFTENAYIEPNNDKMEIYFKLNGEMYKMPEVYSGDLGGREIIVPSNDIYVYFASNASNVYHGIDIESIEEVADVTVDGCTKEDLPTASNTIDLSGDYYPSTAHPYANNSSIIQHYHAYEKELPETADRTGSLVTANITNTRLPDKINVSVYKKDFENANVKDAVLRITGHEDGASYDIDPIEWTTSENGPEIVQLRQGSYILHEKTVPTGYLPADDVAFTIDENNHLIVDGEVVDAIYMKDHPNEVSIPVSKTWDDEGFERYRPESITFDLYDKADMETVVDSLTVGPDDNWEGVFENKPYLDNNGDVIEYKVVERDVQYYNKSIANNGEAEDYVRVRDRDNLPKQVKYTPRPGVKINFSQLTDLTGPALAIWKDRGNGHWYSIGINIYQGTPITFSSDEIYLLYRSYGSGAGIDITSIEPDYDITQNEGYIHESNSLNGVLTELVNYYPENTVSDFWPTLPDESDFTDGSNGYHNSVANEDWENEIITQFIKLKLPEQSEVTTVAPTKQQVESANGFEVTLGDDNTFEYYNFCYFDESTETYKAAGVNAPIDGKLYIPGKIFWIIGYDYGNDTIEDAIQSHNVVASGINGISIKEIKTLNTKPEASTFADYDTYEDFIADASSFMGELIPVDGMDGENSIANTKAKIIGFNYSDAGNIEDETEFVTSAVTATNTFDLHPYEVPFNKINSAGEKIGEAHLELYKGAEKISEWDTVADETHTETLDYGTYVLKETAVPAGYKKAQDITFELTPIGEIKIGGTQVEAVNMTDEDIIVKVRKETTNHAILPGATLQILGNNNEVIRQFETTGEEIELKNIPAGTYTLHELSAPEGYVKADDIIFTISDADGGLTVNEMPTDKLIMFDHPIMIQGRKLNEEGAFLPGATLELYKEGDETPVATIQTTNTSWQYGPTTPGNYILKEKVTVDGYTYAGDIHFTIDENAVMTVEESVVESIDMINKKTNLKIRKTDLFDDLLPGATLQITNETGTVVIDEWVSTDEVHVINGLLKVDTPYKLHEVSAPEEYKIAKDISFTIQRDGTVNIYKDENPIKIEPNANDTINMVDDSKNKIIEPTVSMFTGGKGKKMFYLLSLLTGIMLAIAYGYKKKAYRDLKKQIVKK